jgi:hypothetical protein
MYRKAEHQFCLFCCYFWFGWWMLVRCTTQIQNAPTIQSTVVCYVVWVLQLHCKWDIYCIFERWVVSCSFMMCTGIYVGCGGLDDVCVSWPTMCEVSVWCIHCLRWISSALMVKLPHLDYVYKLSASTAWRWGLVNRDIIMSVMVCSWWMDRTNGWWVGLAGCEGK